MELRGGILVDENSETSQKDIFSVGDASIVKQEITGQEALISLASPANRQLPQWFAQLYHRAYSQASRIYCSKP